MCVGLPARIMKVNNGMAVVDASGAQKEISAQLLKDLEPGDYVMVHAGFAIEKMSEEQAQADLAAIKEVEDAIRSL